MAYVSTNLNLVDEILGGAVSEFWYQTTDTAAVFTGAGYIADATKKGLNKGDIVTVFNVVTPSFNICQVASVTAGAATLKLTAPTQQTITLPLQLADIAAGNFAVGVPFAFTVLSALFRTNKPASTAAKAATLTVSVNAVPVTGGVMALTSANQNTIGGTVAATAITAGNVGTAGQTLGVTASAVTAFIEGDGVVEFTVIPN